MTGILNLAPHHVLTEKTFVIVCSRCGSYRTRTVPSIKLTWTSLRRCFRYECERCGEKFDVSDFDTYTKQHPPDLRRCSNCDKEDSVELIERNHQRPGQPQGEIVDLYRCSQCGQESLRLVQESPGGPLYS